MKMKRQRWKAYSKVDEKDPKNERCSWTLDLKPFRWWFKEMHSCRQIVPQPSYTRKETCWHRRPYKNSDRKVMQPIRITSRTPSRIRNWNQFIKFRWTSTKMIPIENTCTGYVSAMSKRFQRSSKCRVISPTYPFL